MRAAHPTAPERPDSFRRIVHGLERLKSLEQRVTVNLCVNEASYRSLPQYPDLVARYGVQQLHVDIVRPSSTGDRDADYLRAIMPRYTDMAPSFDAMLTRFARELPGFDVNVGTDIPTAARAKRASRSRSSTTRAPRVRITGEKPASSSTSRHPRVTR